MDTTPDTVRDYLNQPYARILTPDEEYGGYTAEILEFPGCITEGDTANEALENLEAAAEGWIEAALNARQRIPEPLDSQGYGGRVALRLPRSLHRRAVQLAEREGTSLNQFLVAAIAESVGTSSLYQSMVQDLGARLDQLTANTATGMIGFPGTLMSLDSGLRTPWNPSLGNVYTQNFQGLTFITPDSPERLAGAANG